MFVYLDSAPMGRMGGGGGGGTTPAATGSSRTFTFLGPNSATVSANMNGSVTMADGITLSTWYFGNGFNDDRTVPSPVIEGIQGQTVNVTLNSMMEHTIHLHGLDVDQANDGVPATSGSVGMGQALGTSYTYTFIAPHAGTYMYHCHVDTVLHFEMGMYGTVIIRPSDGSTNKVWDNGPTFDKEYVWHLHTFDSTWHGGGGMGGGGMGGGGMAVGAPTARHRPDYFMINGRDGSNALNDSTTAISAAAGQRVLIRGTNVGYQPALVQLGGLEFEVIASDGRPLPSPILTTSQLVAPGERYDLLLTMPDTGTRTATVDYYDIRRGGVLGSASTIITVA